MCSSDLVRVEGNELWWPDCPGNKMFNSLGNLAVDPTAALLFTGFGSGRVLHLSGTAVTEWGAPGEPGDDGGPAAGSALLCRPCSPARRSRCAPARSPPTTRTRR